MDRPVTKAIRIEPCGCVFVRVQGTIFANDLQRTVNIPREENDDAKTYEVLDFAEHLGRNAFAANFRGD